MDFAAWHSVVTDDNGAVVPQATITVRHTDTGALARLYNARDGSEPKGNPFQTGADGMISFFASGGAYTVIAAKGTLERRWSFVPIGTAAEYDIDSLAEYLNSGVVYFQTFAEMSAHIPLTYPAAAVVLADADALKNGYYTNSGTGWVFGRALQDTISQLFVTGGGANNPTAAVGQGINPSAPLMFYIDIATPNTGSVTLNISGVGSGVVLNVAGEPLSAGEWQGRIMLTRLPDGRYKLMNDPASALSAALSATQAGDARDAAVVARNAAQGSATAAAGSATAAGNSETAAAGSASDALASKNAAAASASGAAGSASTATTKAGEAAASATAAAGSATTASTKAGEAAASATAAAGSASTATTQAGTATTQANRAETEADRAAAAAGGAVNAVTYISQSLTTSQKTQARANIASVGYEAQTLTEPQKTQVRTNIGSASAAQGTKADSAVQPSDLTKDAVGLGSVDNTSDANKPISTATQTALNTKASYNWIINGDFTINQRGGVKKPANGVYGFDRWKGHASGIEQIIEALPAGEYTLTWSGGGNGTFGGQTKASPIKATVAGGNTSVVVPQTATKVSVVVGDAMTADPWFSAVRGISLEWLMCIRYYHYIQRLEMFRAGGASGASPSRLNTFVYPVRMRVTPTVSIGGFPEYDTMPTIFGATNTKCSFDGNVREVENWGWINDISLDAEI